MILKPLEENKEQPIVFSVLTLAELQDFRSERKAEYYLRGPHSWVFSWLDKSGWDEGPKNQEIQEKATRLRPSYHSTFSNVLDCSNPG